MIAALIAAALTVLPVHGIVLTPIGTHAAIVRLDRVTDTQPGLVRRVALDPAVRLGANAGVDGFLDRSTRPWTLRDALPAGPFAPGVPQPGRVIPVDNGLPLPPYTMVNQNGRLVDLATAFKGKTTLLSFVFTRCKDRDVCPAISAKFTQLERMLDPAHFALVEISLDPPYDSPAVLRAYGAKYSQNPHIWTLLTGTGSTVTRLLDSFGISSLQVSDDDFLHSDKLFVVTPQSRVAYVVETAGWDPNAVVAEARAVDGVASNPFERFKLSLIAGVAAFCGGSQNAGIVLLEVSLFLIICAVAFAVLWVVARVLWRHQAE